MSMHPKRSESTLRKAQPRQGYFLLMVVILLLITSLIAASISIRALAGIAETRRLEEQLQDRWARISLQRAILERGNQCFAAHDARIRLAKGGPHFLDSRYRIAGKVYSVRLSDEQAKFNVIQALKRFPAVKVETSFRNLGTSIRSEVLQPLSELLRNPAADDWKWPARNWASVLQDARVRHARDAVRLRDQTSLITLWGSGQVHVHRAPAEVIESQKKLYGIPNVRSVEEFFSRGQRETTNPTDPVDVDEIQRAFTDASTCYSVWIICDQGKAMSTLTVQTTETGSLSETETFAW